MNLTQATNSGYTLIANDYQDYRRFSARPALKTCKVIKKEKIGPVLQIKHEDFIKSSNQLRTQFQDFQITNYNKPLEIPLSQKQRDRYYYLREQGKDFAQNVGSGLEKGIGYIDSQKELPAELVQGTYQIFMDDMRRVYQKQLVIHYVAFILAIVVALDLLSPALYSMAYTQ